MRSIGGYELLDFLGESNHGLYFRAHPPERLQLDVESVAIKILVDQASEHQFNALAHEVRVLASLVSPYTVRVFEAGHEAGRLYYSMEYMTMGTLAQPSTQPSTADVLRAIAHASSGLALLHARGIVHRDFKPAKVLLHSEGGKLNDLGIAEAHNNGMRRAVPTGSIGFMAPEVARGQPATVLSDIFSVGATIHRVLTGRCLFPDMPRDHLQTALRHVAVTLPHVHPSLPEPVHEIVSACTAIRPEERPQSAQEIARQLLAHSRSSPPLAPRDPGGHPA